MIFYKYQNSSGKTLWYASFHYTDWTGENKRKVKRGFVTKREALEYERSYKDTGKKDPDILFSSLVENYLKDNETRLKPTTLESKEYITEKKLLPYFGKRKISEIDSIMIRRWQNELMSYRDENGEPYADTYLKGIHSQLSAIMNYAVKYYGLRSNPCRAAGSMGRAKAEEMSIWTRDEFEQFIQFEKRPGYRAAFNTLFYTGMRSGELLALTPKDIERDAPIIHINKTFAIVKGEWMILTPKTPKSKRDVAIHHQLHQELLAYIDGMYLDPDDRIFYFTKSGLRACFQRLAKKAGLEVIRLHDLRHSHVSMLIEMGVPIMQISERLGHENVQTTWNTYAHLYPGKDRQISEQIGKLFDPEEMAPEGK